MSVELSCVGGDEPIGFGDQLVSRLKLNENILLSQEVKNCAVNMRGVWNYCDCHMSAKIHQQRKHAFLLGHQLPSLNITYIGRSGVGIQENRKYYAEYIVH